MPLIVKLRSSKRSGVHDVPPEPAAKEQSKDAERMRKNRAKLKVDPVAYTAHLAKEAARLHNYRKNLSSEKKREAREKCRARVQKYRQRQKQDSASGKDGSTNFSPRTRLTEAKRKRQRELWREQKQRYRQKISAQKKRRVRERNSNYQHAKREEAAKRRAERLEAAKLRERQQELDKSREEEVADVLNCVKETISSLKGSGKRCFMNNLTSYTDQKHGMRRKTSKHLGIAYKILQKYSDLRKRRQTGRKKRKDAISQEVITAVHEYMERPDVSTSVPNKKAVHKDGKAKFVLQESLAYTHKKFNEEVGKEKVGKSSFASLRPKNILLHRNAHLEQCLCEVCTNIDLKLQVLNRELGNLRLETIPNKYEASNITLCTTAKIACIDRKCCDCGVKKLADVVEPLVSQCEKNLKWKKWESVEYTQGKKRVALIQKEGPLTEMLSEMKDELQTFPSHLLEARWQQRQFSSLSRRLPPSSMLAVMDFAENYTCVIQREVQSAHWYQQQVTVHPVVCYYTCPNIACKDKDPVRESIIIVSNDNHHDCHAVSHFVGIVADHLHARDPTANRLIQYTDGCTAQYKSRSSVADISYGSRDLPFETVERHYFGSRHGKSPCDGEGGVVKSFVTRAVKANSSISVTDSHSFYTLCKERLTKGHEMDGKCSHSRRTVYEVQEGEINRTRPSRTEVGPLPGIRKLHAVVGLEPYAVKARRFSCFCENCNDSKGDTCENEDIVDEWTVKKLKPLQPQPTEKVQVDVTVIGEQVQYATKPMVPPAENNDCDVAVIGEQVQCTAKPQLCPPAECGDFVQVRLQLGKGKKTADFVGEVITILPGGEVLLKYMEEVRPGVYRWPTSEDISQETVDAIIQRLRNPILLENLSSSRQQLFSFSRNDEEILIPES